MSERHVLVKALANRHHGASRASRGDVTPEVWVKLTGGLANQLFQWSAGHLLASEFRAPLVLDAHYVERPHLRGEQLSQSLAVDVRRPRPLTRTSWSVVNRTLPGPMAGAVRRVANRLHRPAKRVGTLEEARDLLRSGRSAYLVGLFQDSPALYARHDVRDLVRAGLERYAPPGQRKYIAVHVRRGDYVNNATYRATFGVCSAGYYRQALSLLDPGLPVIFVTDDPEWCTALVSELRIAGREARLSGAANHYEDLAILAGANEVVLANSTFSWWGAYLGGSQRIVCPTPWFADPARDRGLARPGWIKVPRDEEQAGGSQNGECEEAP